MAQNINKHCVDRLVLSKLIGTKFKYRKLQKMKCSSNKADKHASNEVFSVLCKNHDFFKDAGKNYPYGRLNLTHRKNLNVKRCLKKGLPKWTINAYKRRPHKEVTTIPFNYTLSEEDLYDDE